jgi:hypothetical protein
MLQVTQSRPFVNYHLPLKAASRSGEKLYGGPFAKVNPESSPETESPYNPPYKAHCLAIAETMNLTPDGIGTKLLRR